MLINQSSIPTITNTNCRILENSAITGSLIHILHLALQQTEVSIHALIASSLKLCRRGTNTPNHVMVAHSAKQLMLRCRELLLITYIPSLTKRSVILPTQYVANVRSLGRIVILQTWLM